MNKRICYVTTLAMTIRAFFVPQLKFLAEHGYEIYVICSPDYELQKDLGENIHYIPISIARGISPLTMRKTICELFKVFKNKKFDMVQYSTPNAAFCASIASKLAGVKIRNYHMMGLRYLSMKGIAGKLFKSLEWFTCKLSTNIECVTESNLKLCLDEGIFKENKAAIVWNGSSGGVDMSRFDISRREVWRNEIRGKYGLDDNDFVFGFVGRITRDKGINEILEAFSNLKEKCKLLIVGGQEGTDTLDVNLWQYANDCENIIILNSVSDIEQYYAAIDCLLLPSYREGFGMVIAEAAAVGTPAIVSNIPGPIDVISEGKTAFTVKAKDAGDLLKKMEFVLHHSQVCEDMSAQCAEYIKEKFDSTVLNEKILERKDRLLEQI